MACVAACAWAYSCRGDGRSRIPLPRRVLQYTNADACAFAWPSTTFLGFAASDRSVSPAFTREGTRPSSACSQKNRFIFSAHGRSRKHGTPLASAFARFIRGSHPYDSFLIPRLARAINIGAEVFSPDEQETSYIVSTPDKSCRLYLVVGGLGHMTRILGVTHSVSPRLSQSSLTLERFVQELQGRVRALVRLC